jgi:hypothetical protein
LLSTVDLTKSSLQSTRVYTKQLNPRADIGRNQQLW